MARTRQAIQKEKEETRGATKTRSKVGGAKDLARDEVTPKRKVNTSSPVDRFL